MVDVVKKKGAFVGDQFIGFIDKSLSRSKCFSCFLYEELVTIFSFLEAYILFSEPFSLAIIVDS